MSYETNNDPIRRAIRRLAQMSQEPTDGKWLEDLTVEIGGEISDWDLDSCIPWHSWPEREQRFPGIGVQDMGIDVVGVRKDDTHIAIQCKSRKLNEQGQGAQIKKSEVDSFISISTNPFWAERWIVTNGDNPLAPNAQQAQSMITDKVKLINIGRDLEWEYQAREQQRASNDSKTLMQKEAVERCVEALKKHVDSDSGCCPIGQTRGRLILPCGAGKTRVSLKIVEHLTSCGELSVVLCPSIALVAQIRKEYLQFRAKEISALAVCSDESAGISPRQEGRTNAQDPTLDTSFVSATEIKGKVTTDPVEIKHWILDGQGQKWINVIFGTYQSGHKIAEHLRWRVPALKF